MSEGLAPTTANFHAIVNASNTAAQSAPTQEAPDAAISLDRNSAGRFQKKPEAQAAEPEAELDPTLEAAEPEAEPESEPAEEVEDLLEKLHHGKKGREILEAIAKGELPIELLAALKGVAKINGAEVPVTFAEALQGYQRASDYSRSKNEAREAQRKAQAEMDGIRRMFEDWGKPEALMRDLKRLGKMDTFHAAAVAYAQDWARNQKWQRENPEAYQLHLQLQKEREEREALTERMQSRPDPKGQEQLRANAEKAEQIRQAAFKEAGITDSPWAKKAFGEAFQSFYEDGGDVGEAVRQAAQATKEYLSEAAQNYASQQRPANDNGKKNPSPLPGRGTAAPAPATVTGGARGPMTTKEIERALTGRR